MLGGRRRPSAQSRVADADLLQGHRVARASSSELKGKKRRQRHHHSSRAPSVGEMSRLSNRFAEYHREVVDQGGSLSAGVDRSSNLRFDGMRLNPSGILQAAIAASATGLVGGFASNTNHLVSGSGTSHSGDLISLDSSNLGRTIPVATPNMIFSRSNVNRDRSRGFGFGTDVYNVNDGVVGRDRSDSEVHFDMVDDKEHDDARHKRAVSSEIDRDKVRELKELIKQYRIYLPNSSIPVERKYTDKEFSAALLEYCQDRLSKEPNVKVSGLRFDFDPPEGRPRRFQIGGNFDPSVDPKISIGPIASTLNSVFDVTYNGTNIEIAHRDTPSVNKPMWVNLDADEHCNPDTIVHSKAFVKDAVLEGIFLPGNVDAAEAGRFRYGGSRVCQIDISKIKLITKVPCYGDKGNDMETRIFNSSSSTDKADLFGALRRGMDGDFLSVDQILLRENGKKYVIEFNPKTNDYEMNPYSGVLRTMSPCYWQVDMTTRDLSSATSAAQTPTSSAAQTPTSSATSATQTPTSSATSAAQTPTSSATSAAQTPTSSAAQTPTSSAAQTPTSSATSATQTPTSSATSAAQTPTSSATSAAQTPTSSATSAAQTPTSSAAQTPTSSATSATQTPTSSATSATQTPTSSATSATQTPTSSATSATQTPTSSAPPIAPTLISAQTSNIEIDNTKTVGIISGASCFCLSGIISLVIYCFKKHRARNGLSAEIEIEMGNRVRSENSPALVQSSDFRGGGIGHDLRYGMRRSSSKVSPNTSDNEGDCGTCINLNVKMVNAGREMHTREDPKKVSRVASARGEEFEMVDIGNKDSRRVPTGEMRTREDPKKVSRVASARGEEFEMVDIGNKDSRRVPTGEMRTREDPKKVSRVASSCSSDNQRRSSTSIGAVSTFV